jgi:hypothetical protein
MATTVLAQVRFTTPSGEMVNTFNFRSAAGYASYVLHAAAVHEALRSFYADDHIGTSSLAAAMASWVERDFEIRTYDWTDPTPRVPIVTAQSMPTGSSSGSGNIPADVAMCVTYQAVPPITRRRRGRIYLGGLGSNAMQEGGPGVMPTFSLGGTAFMARALNACIFLKGNAVGWSIYSRAANDFYDIDGGYIDTEPDTQRRRGDQSGAPERTAW